MRVSVPSMHTCFMRVHMRKQMSIEHVYMLQIMRRMPSTGSLPVGQLASQPASSKQTACSGDQSKVRSTESRARNKAQAEQKAEQVARHSAGHGSEDTAEQRATHEVCQRSAAAWHRNGSSLDGLDHQPCMLIFFLWHGRAAPSPMELPVLHNVSRS